ncbi:MAG TPA: energy transducer TonB [Syntrophales bacterium]|nr:energy transducer TonB [Syntrophales bacterium]
MHLRETLKKNGDVLFAVSVSTCLHLCIALILIVNGAITMRLKFDEDSIVHVFLVSADSGQKSRAGEISDSRTKERTHSKNKENIGHHEVVVGQKEKAKSSIETVRQAVVEKTSIDSEVITIPSRSAVIVEKDTTTSQYSHGIGHDSVAFRNTSVGEASLAVPRYRENPRPVYPIIARVRGYEGLVLISAEVLADGRVGHVKVKRSSGYSILDQSALNAVRKWMFEPAKKMNIPLSMYVDIPLRFSLNDPN